MARPGPSPWRGRARWAAVLLSLLALLAAWGAWRAYRAREAAELVRQAETASNAGRWNQAVRLARQARRIAPRDRQAATVEALALSRLGAVDEAEPMFRRGRTLTIPEMHVRAEGLLRAGRLEEASQVFEAILREDPDEPEALRRLAALRMAHDEWSQALRLAERLKLSPESEVVGTVLAASILYHMSRMPAAIAEFQRALELDPNLAQSPLQPERLFWDRYAHALLLEGRPAEAREALQRGLGRGDDATLRDRLGQVFWNEGRMDDALTEWRRARDLDPALADPWFNLGRLAMSRGNMEEAVRDLEQAVALSPDSENAWSLLARAYHAVGRETEADQANQRRKQLHDRTATESGSTSINPRGQTDTRSRRILDNSQ